MEIITDESKLPKELREIIDKNKEYYSRYKIAYKYFPPEGTWEMHLYTVVMKPTYVEHSALLIQAWFGGDVLSAMNKILVDKQTIQMFWGL